MLEQVPQQDENNKAVIGNGTEFKPLLKKVPTPVALHVSIAEDDEESKENDINGTVLMIVYLFNIFYFVLSQIHNIL